MNNSTWLISHVEGGLSFEGILIILTMSILDRDSLRISVNGAEIFFDVEGSGLELKRRSIEEKPVMAILHGGPALDHSYFKPWLTPLSEYAQLIYVDHRGTGRSAKVPLPTCTIEQMADDLEELRMRLGIQNWAVLGNSYGGMWGLTYATRHEKSLSHLTLVDTLAAWKECWKDAQKMAEKWGTAQQKKIYRDLFLGKTHGEKQFKHWFETMLPLYFHKYKKEYMTMISRVKGAPDVAEYMWQHVMNDYDVRGKIRKLQVPTLVTVGRYDWVTPVSQSEYLANNIPNSKLVIFERSGHFPFMEERAKFNRTVLQFLAQN